MRCNKGLTISNAKPNSIFDSLDTFFYIAMCLEVSKCSNRFKRISKIAWVKIVPGEIEVLG